MSQYDYYTMSELDKFEEQYCEDGPWIRHWRVPVRVGRLGKT